MKAIFPCKGTVVLTKHNVDVLHNIYTDNIVNSKLFDIYNHSDYSIQVGTFNYMPKKATIVTENTNFLSVQQLHKILGEHMAQTPAPQASTSLPQDSAEEAPENSEPLDDNFVLNHPFFETLKPLD